MKWIDTHVHLAADFDYAVLDKTAEKMSSDGKVWLHAIDGPRQRPNNRFHAVSEKVLEVAKHYPGFFEPFACVDLLGKPEQIDRFADQGFTGLKFIYPPGNYDDMQFMPFYERANALGMPCFFHVGIIAKRGSKDFVLPGRNGSPGRMKPSMLDTIGAEFPDLKLVAGHMGVPWCNELFETLWYYPNVRCSVCGLSDYKWLIDLLGNASSCGVPFSKKMMFGSDFCYGIPGQFEMVEERLIFFKVFFEEVGRMYSWGNSSEDFFFRNAEEFIPGKYKK